MCKTHNAQREMNNKKTELNYSAEFYEMQDNKNKMYVILKGFKQNKTNENVSEEQ